MSDTDDLESIRQKKREQLEARLDGDSSPSESEKGSATPTEPIHVDGGTHLERVVDDHDVVLVDFYADWCGPCKMLEPTVAELARESEAAVAKVDIDAHQSLAAQYNVRGVPTLVLFADGRPVEQLVGVQDKATLSELIGQHA